MSVLKKVPMAHSENIASIADFAEVECLRRSDRAISTLKVATIMSRESDSSNDETIIQRVAEAFEELADRTCHCGPFGERYPYAVTEDGRVLSLRDDVGEESLVYIYLLLATQMSMQTQKNQGGEDATVLFEHLSSEVAVRYFGGPGPSIRTMVFGTGREAEDKDEDDELDQGKFETAVNNLCKELREGGGFESYANSRVTARDGKLDVVVWRHFADRRGGQLIGFGQCKTGKYWNRDLTKLQPR